MSQFSVVLFTAAPPGLAAEAGGAFVKIDGRETLLKSVELFLNRENVKQIQVIFLPEGLEEAKKKFGPHFGFSGVKVAGGGPKWTDQLAAAKIDPEATHVLVHDAARPAVAYTDIEAIMEAAEKHAAVALATPVRAGLVEVDEGGNPLGYRLPSEFMQLVTPMVFTKAKFAELAKSKAEPHASELTLVKGSPLNIRVGSDVSLAKAMINLLPKPKIKAANSPFDEAQW